MNFQTEINNLLSQYKGKTLTVWTNSDNLRKRTFHYEKGRIHKFQIEATVLNISFYGSQNLLSIHIATMYGYSYIFASVDAELNFK